MVIHVNNTNCFYKLLLVYIYRTAALLYKAYVQDRKYI